MHLNENFSKFEYFNINTHWRQSGTNRYSGVPRHDIVKAATLLKQQLADIRVGRNNRFNR